MLWTCVYTVCDIVNFLGHNSLTMPLIEWIKDRFTEVYAYFQYIH